MRTLLFAFVAPVLVEWFAAQAPCAEPAAIASAAAVAGGAVDVAPFGAIMRWGTDGKDYGVMWEDLRDIARVVVRFADPHATPDPSTLRLEYWQSGWPKRRIPRDQPSGAGNSGWLDIGDWFQGKWQAADAAVEKDGGTCTFTFRPVNAKEFPDVGDFAATYRTTLKLRLVAAGAALPAIATFAAYTDSTWQPLTFEIEWGGTPDRTVGRAPIVAAPSGDGIDLSGGVPVGTQIWDGRLEAFNGIVQAVEPLSAKSGVAVAYGGTWQSRVAGETDGIRARVLYAATKGYNSFDATVFTVRAEHATFSFAAADLARWGSIPIPDYSVIVRKAGETATLAAAEKARRETGAPKDVYRRVFDEAEQTFSRSWGAVPQKDPHYIPLSFEGGRQHFGADEHGEVFAVKNWIERLRGRDTDRCRWPGEEIRYRFALPKGKPVERNLVDGDLPIIAAAWEEDGIRYRQTAFVMPLAGVPKPGERIRADDTLVLFARFSFEPVGRGGEARLSFHVNHGGGEERLVRDGDRILAAGEPPGRLRMLVRTAAADKLGGKDGRVVFAARLGSGEKIAPVDVAIPYVTLVEDVSVDELRAITYDAAFDAVRAYWRGRIAAGTQIKTPEPMIDDFYRAHVSHLLINTEREVGESDCYMAKVGTFHYGVYANESCMMVSDLDRRGYHERAAQALDAWISHQGSVGLPGDFSTKEGQFYGVGGYESGGYNQHHGWVLWCLGEHYFLTRDASWLARVAPAIVKGCAWIQGERRRTIEEAARTPLRAIARGLLPPGRLEDIGDWRPWLSTNVYTWWGMSNAAAALAAAGHPEGTRIVAEAETYRADILAAFGEAMRRSPVVRLRDGSWIPHVPAEAHRRGRTFGWITETLEGAIHLARTELIDPRSQLATWIIQDFEDNLYLSEQFGYDLKGEAFERDWFSLGGISMQANLLHNPIPYVLRDEPKHFLRAYFNAFAVSYWPDTRMMTEHALPNIGDWRGDHYKSSDEANSTYYLRLMFVEERGEDLWLGAAIPRYWLEDGKEIGIERSATFFGPVSMAMRSRAAAGSIEMAIEPPLRNPPKRIFAHFRHPAAKAMVRCEVDGKPFERTGGGAARSWGPLKGFAARPPAGALPAPGLDRAPSGSEWVVLEGVTKPVKIVAFYEK